MASGSVPRYIGRMPRKFYEYVLKVRPHRRHRKGSTQRQRAGKPKTVRVVARSKFDAELVYRNHHPRMMVVEATRGPQVDPPEHMK